MSAVVTFVDLGCTNTASEKNGPSESTAEKDTVQKGKFYDLYFRIEDVSSRHVVTVNGFPVEKQNVMSRATNDQYGIDLNTALVGEGNKVEVRMIPYLEASGSSLDVGTIEYTAEVQSSTSWETHGGVPVEGAEITSSEVDIAYKEWVKQAEKQWSEYRSEIQQGAIDSLRRWAERNPLTVQATFDNEAGPDFSRIFEEAPRLEDISATRKRLKDYAIHLRDLLQAGNAEAIYEEFRPSVSKDLGWFKITRSGRRDSAIAHIRTDWTERWKTDFTRSEVELRRWSGGRVWELLVREEEGGLRPFFEGEAATSLDVYVAEIGGELKVVR